MAALFIIGVVIVLGLICLYHAEGGVRETFNCACIIGGLIIFTLWLWWFTTPQLKCLHFDSANHEFFEGSCING